MLFNFSFLSLLFLVAVPASAFLYYDQKQLLFFFRGGGGGGGLFWLFFVFVFCFSLVCFVLVFCLSFLYMIDILFTQYRNKATISKFYSKAFILKNFMDCKCAFYSKISKLTKVLRQYYFCKTFFQINLTSRKS